jgi:hypothetical protein
MNPVGRWVPCYCLRLQGRHYVLNTFPKTQRGCKWNAFRRCGPDAAPIPYRLSRFNCSSSNRSSTFQTQQWRLLLVLQTAKGNIQNGGAVAAAVNRRLHAAAVRVRARVILCGFSEFVNRSDFYELRNTKIRKLDLSVQTSYSVESLDHWRRVQLSCRFCADTVNAWSSTVVLPIATRLHGEAPIQAQATAVRCGPLSAVALLGLLSCGLNNST